jgi:hypothetical protein
MYADHLEGDGARLLEDAARLGFEGIISKRADAPYRSDRSLGEGQVRAAGQVFSRRLRQGPNGGGRAALWPDAGRNRIFGGPWSGELLGRSEGTRDCARHLAAEFGVFDGASSDLVKAHNAISISTDHFWREAAIHWYVRSWERNGRRISGPSGPLPTLNGQSPRAPGRERGP